MTAEDFAAWLEHPVTKWVQQAYESLAAENKAAWIEASWEQGKSDPMMLQELRVRADAYRSIAECEFEAFAETNGATNAE